ncbi:MAG: hypothetical protein A4S09_02355 [Proteobacteria bacterium SG_bin7]|nr:MAG: hypothetical protein A4S09_02355 [Proteobacteria bacterium SG_bin7]
MQGGVEKTIAKAVKNPKVRSRIGLNQEIIIDEISMIHPLVFEAANRISKQILQSELPFGGTRLVVVGDFFQLPPVDRFEKKIPWIFESDLWKSLNFGTVELSDCMRSSEKYFVDILQKIRWGRCDETVCAFLDAKKSRLKSDFMGTILFARKAEVESYNQRKLDSLGGELRKFPTEVITRKALPMPREKVIEQSPLPQILFLKEGALVMIRKNDESGLYVNGSLGVVKKISTEIITLELLDGTRTNIEKDDFHILDGDGKTVATIRNFPLTLGWAITIHKAQGSSIDRLFVNLNNLWEYGQAYVALSRAKDPEYLFVGDWTLNSIKADSGVKEFYSQLNEFQLI